MIFIMFCVSYNNPTAKKAPIDKLYLTTSTMLKGHCGVVVCYCKLHVHSLYAV